MKKMFLLLALTATVGISNAQIRKIPSAVTDAFKAKYGNPSGVEWKDKVTSFMAGFTKNDVKIDAYFNTDGSWVETDKYIDYNAVPAAAKDGYKKSKYNPDWTIQQSVIVEKPDGTQTRLRVKKSDLQVEYLYFDTDGKLVKEAVKL